jgi:hypothetical protein
LLDPTAKNVAEIVLHSGRDFVAALRQNADEGALVNLALVDDFSNRLDSLAAQQQASGASKIVRSTLRASQKLVCGASFEAACENGVRALLVAMSECEVEQRAKLLEQLNDAGFVSFSKAGDRDRDLLTILADALRADDYDFFLWLCCGDLSDSTLVASYLSRTATKTSWRFARSELDISIPAVAARMNALLHRKALSLSCSLFQVGLRAVLSEDWTVTRRLDLVSFIERVCQISRYTFIAEDVTTAPETPLRRQHADRRQLTFKRLARVDRRAADADADAQALAEQHVSLRVDEAFEAFLERTKMAPHAALGLVPNQYRLLLSQAQVLIGEFVNRTGAFTYPLVRAMLGIAGVEAPAVLNKLSALLVNWLLQHTVFQLPAVVLPLVRVLDRLQPDAPTLTVVVQAAVDASKLLLQEGIGDAVLYVKAMGSFVEALKAAVGAVKPTVAVLFRMISISVERGVSASTEEQTATKRRRRDSEAADVALLGKLFDDDEDLLERGAADGDLRVDVAALFADVEATLANASSGATVAAAARSHGFDVQGDGAGSPYRLRVPDLNAATATTCASLLTRLQAVQRAASGAPPTAPSSLGRFAVSRDDALRAAQRLLGISSVEAEPEPERGAARRCADELAKLREVVATSGASHAAMRPAQTARASDTQRAQTLESGVAARRGGAQLAGAGGGARGGGDATEEDEEKSAAALAQRASALLPLFLYVAQCRLKLWLSSQHELVCAPMPLAPDVDERIDAMSPVYLRTVLDRINGEGGGVAGRGILDAADLGFVESAVGLQELAWWQNMASHSSRHRFNALLAFAASGAPPLFVQVHRSADGAVLCDSTQQAAGHTLRVPFGFQCSASGKVHIQSRVLR